MPVEARASAAYLVCSVLQRGLSLITLPIFSRVLTQVEYGQSTIYNSWMSILAVFISLYLGFGSFSTAMVKFEDDRGRYIAAVNGVVVSLALLFVALYLPLREVLNPLLELPTWVMLLMVAHIVANHCLQCFYARERFEYRYRRVVAVTLVTSVASVAVALLLVAASSERGYARILGGALPQVCVGLGLFAAFALREHTFFNRKYWRYALSFNLPLVPYYLSQMVFNQSDRIMISHVCGTADAAVYGVAYTLATLLTFVLDSINGAYVPWFYGKIKDGKLSDNRRVSLGIATLLAALLLLVIIAAPEVILVMAGRDYAGAAPVVGPVAMGLVFLFCAQLFVNVQFFYEEKWLLVIAAAIAGIVNVVLNWLLLPAFGYVIAAYTTLLSYVLVAAVNWLMYRHVLRKHGIADEMFDYRGMGLLVAAFLVCGFGSMALYPLPVMRYGLVLVLMAVAYAKRRTIAGLVGDVRSVGRDE